MNLNPFHPLKLTHTLILLRFRQSKFGNHLQAPLEYTSSGYCSVGLTLQFSAYLFLSLALLRKGFRSSLKLWSDPYRKILLVVSKSTRLQETDKQEPISNTRHSSTSDRVDKRYEYPNHL
ncbi:uncharacterized protein LOC112174322 [Rosa chinensis]|uniref:uncharacterized protein LOC112174322 n=1 Tax=Rosa chinensis TaxID=74649 RepID=UPI001AD93AB1|nr:uncharacterized protein LOC112174322 [Rosa chinensis]